MRSQSKRLTSELSSFVAAATAAVLFLLSSAPVASAQEIYYFSDKARDLEVSADAETLLVFPAAPFARVCQPTEIAEFYPLQSVDELQSMLLPSGRPGACARGDVTGNGAISATDVDAIVALLFAE